MALAVGFTALVVYSRTMYPGLVGDGDTPKFQFVGRILGTPHNPGYPLYTLLSYFFSRLPWGSVAYRINLMSVFFGSATAALAFLVIRRLGCRAGVAAATALAQAFGPVLWSQALLAEVYTLGTTLLLAVLLSMVGWAATDNRSLLYAATAFVALGLGHHHADMVAVAPALVLYALSWNAASVLNLKMLVVSAAILVLGLGQYGFILLRTIQHAPYLGSSATNARELWGVVRAAQFSNRLFAFGSGALFHERIPLAGRLFCEELGPAGVALLLLGCVLSLRRRPREVLLLGVATTGVVFFALNYDVPDTPVFMIPAFVLSWPLVGAGLEGVVGWLEERVTWGAAAISLLLPASQLFIHYRTHDHHRHAFEMRYFRAFLESLPSRSAILAESYTVDQMILYELFGEDFVHQKEVLLSGGDAESAEAYLRKGYRVYVFERGRAELASRGFRLSPVKLLESSLETYLKGLRRDSIVLLAGPVESQETPLKNVAAALKVLGGGEMDGRIRGGCYTAIGMAQAPRGAALAVDPERADLEIQAGGPIGETGRQTPVPLRAACTPAGGLVMVNGREIARSAEGLAIAVVNSAGQLLDRKAVDSAEGLQVPFNARAFPAYRVDQGPSCIKLGSGDWVDLSADGSWGRLIERIEGRATGKSLIVYLSGEVRPRLVGPERPPSKDREFNRAAPALLSALQGDGLRAHGFTQESVVHRFEVQAIGDADRSLLTLDLGGIPDHAWARAQLDPTASRRVTICRLPLGGVSFFEDKTRIVVGPDDRPFFGQGWEESSREGLEIIRSTTRPEALVLVPLSRVGAIRVELRVRPPLEKTLASLSLVVNGQPSETRALREGWSNYTWHIPGVVWRKGSNELRLVFAGAGAQGAAGGVALSQLRLTLEDSP